MGLGSREVTLCGYSRLPLLAWTGSLKYAGDLVKELRLFTLAGEADE